MTDDRERLAERIDALETRLAYQDETVEALNRTVTEQWSAIEAMKRALADMAERLEDAAGGIAPVERPPPHY